jgi:hypothetical protein
MHSAPPECGAECGTRPTRADAVQPVVLGHLTLTVHRCVGLGEASEDLSPHVEVLNPPSATSPHSTVYAVADKRNGDGVANFCQLALQPSKKGTKHAGVSTAVGVAGSVVLPSVRLIFTACASTQRRDLQVSYQGDLLGMKPSRARSTPHPSDRRAAVQHVFSPAPHTLPNHTSSFERAEALTRRANSCDDAGGCSAHGATREHAPPSVRGGVHLAGACR